MQSVTEYALLALDVVRNDLILSGLAVLVLFSFIRTFFLSHRLTRLMRGGDGKTLEGTIKKLQERVNALETHAETVERALENVDGRLQTSLRGVSVERFDPFHNAGGQQSFATALLNEQGNGVVLSGIHSRDGVRVYAKEVATFTSERELSEEESRAIKAAGKQIGN